MQLNTKRNKHDFYLVLKDMVILCCNRGSGCDGCCFKYAGGTCKRVSFRSSLSIEPDHTTGEFDSELLYAQFATMASFTCDCVCKDCSLSFTSGCALNKLKSLFGET